jgi:hypothetical protein
MRRGAVRKAASVTLSSQNEKRSQMFAKELRVYTIGRRHFIFVPQGRGEQLGSYLNACGIETHVNRIPSLAPDRLELTGDVDPSEVQSILDAWKETGSVPGRRSPGASPRRGQKH